MGAVNPTADPANVVQALVHTLLNVFDATRDLYQTLRSKEKRDHEESLRSKGYPHSRRIEYVEDGTDESIVMDKAAVTRQFEIGFQQLGTQFAVGDVLSQTALQSQIITLQSVIITIFLYGPTSPKPISDHLSNSIAASRVAGTTAVDVLAAQLQRQLAIVPLNPRSTQSPVAHSGLQQPPPYPVTTVPSTTSASPALVKSRHEPPYVDEHVVTNPTIANLAIRPKTTRTDTESTSFSGLTSYGTQSAPHALFCLYALDLQRHPSQALSSSITSNSSPYCPYCKRALHLSPGRSWEVYKDDNGVERCFQIQNRFVVKCHREGVDGGYSCVLCSRASSVDTVCGDVKALVRHIWMDHGLGELELEEDAIEVVEKSAEQRRDSGLALSESRSSRRSLSMGPGRGKGRRFEREVETLKIRSPRSSRREV